MKSRAIAALPVVISGLLLSPVAARADKPIGLEARLAQSVMKSGEKQRNFLRVALNGCKPERTDRTPVNVAFVIDRSGSMAGSRIAQAREAAIMAISRLDANDIASVVIFDDKVDVLVDARNRSATPPIFTDRVRQVGVRGSTAIHAGVMEGAERGPQVQGPRAAQPRRAAVRRPGQCRADASPRISPSSGATFWPKAFRSAPSGSASTTTRT